MQLEDGSKVYSKVVASNTHVKLLFEKLVDLDKVDSDFRFQLENFRSKSGSFRMNVALSAAPKWSCLKNKPEAEMLMAGSIYIAPSLEYMDQALHEAKTNEVCRNPVMEILMPSPVRRYTCT